MSLTTSFLFLFITIVIPGFIFQRIYFFGDFSKQFTTKENVPKLLLTTLLPGLIISTFYLPFYNYFVLNDVKIDQILKIFEMLSKSKLHENESLLKVFGNYSDFIFYCLFEFLFAAIIGFLMSRALVRGLKLDRKWKTLRYKNQWYYVFSGEIFDFGKFKRATKVLKNKEKSQEAETSIIQSNRKVIRLARADILIKGAEGSELYTGYVADYDLNPTDISKLDNLYLLDANRYKITQLIEGEPNVKEPYYTEKKMIPGELFVLNMANVVNINVSYLLEPISGAVKGQLHKIWAIIIRLIIITVLFPLSIFIFYNPTWMDFFSFSLIKWYFKIPLFMMFTNLVGSVFPRYDSDKKVYYYKKSDLIIGGIILFLLIVFYFSIFIFF